jgi:hypothetical protein
MRTYVYVIHVCLMPARNKSMHMHMYVHSIHASTCLHACTHTLIHTIYTLYTRLYTYAYVRTEPSLRAESQGCEICILINMYACMYACMCGCCEICILINMYACMHVCVCGYVYVLTCMHAGSKQESLARSV